MTSFAFWRALARGLAVGLALVLAGYSQAAAQQPAPMDHSQHGAPPMQMDHSQHGAPPPAQMDHSQHGTPAATDHSQHGKPKAAPSAKPRKSSAKPAMDHSGHAASARRTAPIAEHSGHQAGAHDGGHQGAAMPAFLGRYPSTREGSGTSWVPDATPHEGVHGQLGPWTTMVHGQFNAVYDNQGGPRGARQTFASGMLMGMARKETDDGAIGLRAMLSPDPFMGPRGYPLLLATGETADGRTHLVDRQHPHDLFMELATTFSKNLSSNASVFVYGGLPGEPALGPPAFMHRTSGMDIPEAPITHHWLDSTHITFGVVTAGVIVDTWKLEASAFRGREPDQHRYDIEAPKLDSASARLSWNPAKEWSLQVSYGRLRSPEALDPTLNENRLTASAIYTTPFAGNNLWSTTFAWGRKMLQPGPTLDGVLLESAVILQNTITLFARAERVQESELLHEDDLMGFGLTSGVFTVSKVSAGAIYDFYRTEHAKFGIGGLISGYDIPAPLKPFYGDPTSGMVFLRLKVI